MPKDHLLNKIEINKILDKFRKKNKRFKIDTKLLIFKIKKEKFKLNKKIMNYYKVQIRISLKKISQSEIKLFKIIIMDKMISMIMSKIKI